MFRNTVIVLALGVALILGINASFLTAQEPTQTAKPAILDTRSSTLLVSIDMSQTEVPIGHSPIVHLSIKNVGDQTIAFPHDLVRVEGTGGEAPTTLRQRQLTQRLNPSEPQLMGGGFEPEIEAGKSLTRSYNLSDLYELKTVGNYSVFIQVLDEAASKHNAGVWVRTKTLQFQMVPAK